MPRAFILKASEGRSAPDFSLKSLAGSPGRMDLVARCLIASLLTMKGPRRDTLFTVILEGPPDPPATLTFDGSVLAVIPTSEVLAARMIYDALSGTEITGVHTDRKSFGNSVKGFKAIGFSLYYLHENGADSRRMDYKNLSAFVLGDQKGLDPGSERIMDQLGAERVSLGPHSYLASHCINMVNNELDQAR